MTRVINRLGSKGKRTEEPANTVYHDLQGGPILGHRLPPVGNVDLSTGSLLTQDYRSLERKYPATQD